MSNSNPYRFLNIVGLAAVLAANALAQFLPLNGHTTGELSDRHPVLVTPAGFAFSIWSLIYLLLIGYVFYQARGRMQERPAVRSVGPWFLISCLLNVAWIFVWHYEYVTSSAFVMIALLLSLIILYSRIQHAAARPTPGETYWVKLPFSLYLGWICVATIVNIAVALSNGGWNGFGLTEAAWAVIVLALGLLLALVNGGVHRDIFFVLVFVWAYIAIAVKQYHEQTVMSAAIVGAALLALYAGILILGKRKRAKW